MKIFDKSELFGNSETKYSQKKFHNNLKTELDSVTSHYRKDKEFGKLTNETKNSWFEIKLKYGGCAYYYDMREYLKEYIAEVDNESRNILNYFGRHDESSFTKAFKDLKNNKLYSGEMEIVYIESRAIEQHDDPEIYLCIPYARNRRSWYKIALHDYNASKKLVSYLNPCNDHTV